LSFLQCLSLVKYILYSPSIDQYCICPAVHDVFWNDSNPWMYFFLSIIPIGASLCAVEYLDKTLHTNRSRKEVKQFWFKWIFIDWDEHIHIHSFVFHLMLCRLSFVHCSDESYAEKATLSRDGSPRYNIDEVVNMDWLIVTK
jgi:hypothetical protein